MSDEGFETPSGLARVGERLGFGADAVRHLMRAMEAGGGTMAQFDHPELGGFGQWSSGGMVMVGRMFDSDLKARVSALCAELSRALPPGGWTGPGEAPRAGWWPAGLGAPSTSGAQNAMRYAYFPAFRRLAVETDGQVALYDTGPHDITGVSQQQGGSQTLRFTDRAGTVDLESLTRLDGSAPEAPPPPQPRPFEPEPLSAIPAAEPAPAPRPVEPAPAEASGGPTADILATIERLSDMHRKGVLTEAEFSGKKADLLSRL